ncbi:chaperonin CPN60-like protein 2, mitochondrial [Tanacetum coccineum]
MQIISEAHGSTLNDVSLDKLGTTKKVTVSLDDTLVLHGGGDKMQMEEICVAAFKVGGASEAEDAEQFQVTITVFESHNLKDPMEDEMSLKQIIYGSPKIKHNNYPPTWMLEASSTSGEAVIGVDFSQIYSALALYKLMTDFAYIWSMFILDPLKNMSEISVKRYGYIKNHKKTVKNGQARTRESEEYKKKPKNQSRSQKSQASSHFIIKASYWSRPQREDYELRKESTREGNFHTRSTLKRNTIKPDTRMPHWQSVCPIYDPRAKKTPPMIE